MEVEDDVFRSFPRSRHNKLYCALLGGLCVVVLILVVLVIVFASSNVKDNSNTSPMSKQLTGQYGELCTTPSCISAASRMLESMNQAVSPCDDFYEFSCGRYASAHPRPHYESYYDVFQEIEDRTLFSLRGMLESGEPNEAPFNYSQSTKFVKRVYDACIDVDSSSGDVLQPIREVISSSTGWTLGREGTDPGGRSWAQVLASLTLQRELSSQQYLYSAHPKWTARTVDDTATSATVEQRSSIHFTLHESEPFLPRFMYLPDSELFHYDPTCTLQQLQEGKCPLTNVDPSDTRTREEIFEQDDNIQKYKQHLLRIVTLYDKSVDGNILSKQVDDIVRFERQLANLTSGHRILPRAPDTYPLNVTHDKFQNLLLADYFSTLLEPTHDLSVSNVMVTTYPEVIESLNNLLANYKDGKLLKNYFLLRFLIDVAPYLSFSFRKEAYDLSLMKLGTNEQIPRWQECFKFLEPVFFLPLNTLYINKHLDDSHRDQTTEIIQRVKEASTKIISDIPWIDQQTKTALSTQVQAMKGQVGFPRFTAEVLDASYSWLDMGDDVELDDYVSFVLHLWKSSTKATLTHEMHDVMINNTKLTESFWFWSHFLVKSYAHYYMVPRTNTLFYSSELLRPPISTPGLIKSLNYGTLGTLTARMITMSLRDSLQNSKKVLEAAQCLQRHYEGFTPAAGMDDLHLELRMIELVVEHVAARVAYQAHEYAMRRDSTSNLKLPGLQEFTPSQLMFISYSQMRCEQATEEGMMLEKISHPGYVPGRQRVLGVLSNIEEFAEVFHCPLNSTMNRKEKCMLW